MRYRLRTLKILVTLACIVAEYVGWVGRIGEEIHRGIHPEHFDEHGKRKRENGGY